MNTMVVNAFTCTVNVTVPSEASAVSSISPPLRSHEVVVTGYTVPSSMTDPHQLSDVVEDAAVGLAHDVDRDVVGRRVESGRVLERLDRLRCDDVIAVEFYESVVLALVAVDEIAGVLGRHGPRRGQGDDADVAVTLELEVEEAVRNPRRCDEPEVALVLHLGLERHAARAGRARQPAACHRLDVVWDPVDGDAAAPGGAIRSFLIPHPGAPTAGIALVVDDSAVGVASPPEQAAARSASADTATIATRTPTRRSSVFEWIMVRVLSSRGGEGSEPPLIEVSSTGGPGPGGAAKADHYRRS
jgi:hypothetical protein